jgi:hypothetical protein
MNRFPIKKPLGLLAISLLGSLAIASPASAVVGKTPPALPPLDEETCTHQPLSQPLLPFGDANYYVMAPGGTFSSAAAWYLTGGAKLVATTQPDGTTGNVLQLPNGAQASGPVMCITREYPMSRLFARAITGSTGDVYLNVQHWDGKRWSAPRDTGGFRGVKKSWTLSGELPISPHRRSGWQQVRFTLVAGGKGSTFQVDNFWVDPRASR